MACSREGASASLGKGPGMVTATWATPDARTPSETTDTVTLPLTREQSRSQRKKMGKRFPRAAAAGKWGGGGGQCSMGLELLFGKRKFRRWPVVTAA